MLDSPEIFIIKILRYTVNYDQTILSRCVPYAHLVTFTREVEMCVCVRVFPCLQLAIKTIYVPECKSIFNVKMLL